jgi:hopanoid-associated phosphorylase
MSVVGLVTALRAEASCVTSARVPFNQVLSLNEQSSLWLSGMGAAAASTAAQGLCRHGVVALASFGVAGALDARLKPGDLILPDAIQTDTALPVDPAWRERLRQRLPAELTVIGGTIAHSETTVTDEQAKRKLAQTTGACAVDMESAAIAAVAAQNGIPFIAVRVIVDPLHFSPPGVLLSAIHPDGGVKPLQLTALLLGGSVNIATLLRMGSAMKMAQQTLSRVIHSAGVGLASI